MNYPPSEERLPGSSYRNRYPFIIPSKLKIIIIVVIVIKKKL